MPGVHPVPYHETFGNGSGVGRESDGRMHGESIILRFCRLLPLCCKIGTVTGRIRAVRSRAAHQRRRSP